MNMNVLEKYPFLQLFCIKFFLSMHYLYQLCWTVVFRIIGNLILIYHIYDGKLRNITFNYYFGYNMDKYKTGCYYLKICDINGVNHIAFFGNLDDIKPNDFIICGYEDPPKRKNIILYNGEKIITFNLDILDNYFVNIKNCQSKIKPIKNLGKIFDFFGIKCTNIVLINLYPFKMEKVKPDDIDIDYLYSK